MKNEEKAYIAGDIDGEGSIMLIRFHYNQLPSPCLSITSTTLELLQWIKSKTRVGSITSKKNYNLERHKNSFTYVVKYNDALWLLEEIKPYLVIESKKKRARLLIEDYKKVTPRNGRYPKEILEAKDRFYENFIGIK